MFYQRDFIMRMIEQMTTVVAQVVGLKRDRKPAEIIIVVNASLEKMFRLNSNLINSLSDRDLLDMMKTNDLLQTEKALAVGYLLKEEGEALEALDRKDESYRRYMKSLSLFLSAAYEGANTKMIDFHLQIDELLVHLENYELPVSYQLRLFTYYDQSGRFADAEDAIFNLAVLSNYELNENNTRSEDQQITMETISNEGLLFYERILAKDDITLIEGRLPRQEAIDGYEEWQQKYTNLIKNVSI